MIKHLAAAGIAALVSAGVSAAWTPAAAQKGEGGRGGGPAKAFERLDKDNDGVLTVEEAREPGRKFFKRADTDDDGVIDADEGRAFKEKLTARKPKAGEKAAARLEKADADNDGEVTEKEALELPRWFEKADKDDDGKITKAEIDAFGERRRGRDADAKDIDAKDADAKDDRDDDGGDDEE